VTEATTSSTKWCPRCKTAKDADENNFYRKTAARDGLSTYCKKCHSDWTLRYKKSEGGKLRTRELRRELAENNPEEHQRQLRLRKTFRYHVDFDALWAEQKGLCAVCLGPMLPSGQSPDAVVVDHDRACCPTDKYSCGQCVRGLIHKRCNILLGHCRDKVPVLEGAIVYLKLWMGRKRDVVAWVKKPLGPRASLIRAELAQAFREQSHAWFTEKRAA
jgi:hypothetical protein